MAAAFVPTGQPEISQTQGVWVLAHGHHPSTHTFSGLTAGVIYKIDVSALGAASPSDWSNPASLTAD